jgi:hypothetical protein
MRRICLGLLGVTTVWGCVFMFVGWFDILPPSGFWDRSVKTKCYGFGFGDDGIRGYIAVFEAHAASNMCLDLAIFVMPLVLLKNRKLKMQTLLAMAGVLVCGAT